VDPVGLCTDRVSGRYPLTLDEVWAYYDGVAPDVIYSTSPPATAGVTDPDRDPGFVSKAVRENLDRGVEMVRYWDPAKVRENAWREMCYVRDKYEFGTCYYLDGTRWLIAYVRRTSPRRAPILQALRSSRWADRESDLAPTYVTEPRALGADSD